MLALRHHCWVVLVVLAGCGSPAIEYEPDATDTDSQTEDGDSEDGDSEDGDSEDGGSTGEEALGECGDGVLDPNEDCDGAELGDHDCTELGFSGGVLACADDCTLDTSACTEDLCGNGVIDGDEECDGADFGGINCVDLGFGPGLPVCTVDCTLDTSTCPDSGEGEPCGFQTPCPNGLACVMGTCHDGSPGDPCQDDGDCQSNDCVPQNQWGGDGICS